MIITKEQFQESPEYKKKILEGAVFIYPTDTIYGIGCDATNDKSVKRIREIKKREKNPFSVIAPSKEWIYTNFEISPEADDCIQKLPGPYTLILKMKTQVVSKHVSTKTLGIRIPNHWCTQIAELSKKPIVTTSANIAGKKFMTSTDDLDPSIKVDFILSEGELNGHPSTLVDLTGEKAVIQKR